MNHSLISSTITRLRSLTQVNIQTHWYSWQSDNINLTMTRDFTNWQKCELNPKEHISFPAGGQICWLGQKIVIPQALENYPLSGLALRLVLTWWAKDAQIFVNGTLVQQGDLFDSATRILVNLSVKPGEEIIVILRLVSPDNDAGALVRSLCIYESNDEQFPEPSFIADELTILQQYLAAFAPEELAKFTAVIEQIDWQVLPNRQLFDRSLATLRHHLIEVANKLSLKQRKISLLGHSHLDLAWLWPISETWEVAQRTFASVLQLQQHFPNLIYCHSSPALYAWIETNCPDLFATIQQQVAAGKWEIAAGMWVEPDLNLINGESIVRQILYGQLYTQEKFGKLSTSVWLPDSFGFCATLPQFLQQGGIEYFVTQKLTWNDTTKFPHQLFWWRSPDGSQVLSLMSAPIGEGIDPLKMANYEINWEQETGLQNALWLFGCGDHGGGPTQDMLEVANCWQKSPFFPTLKFTTVNDYLQQVSHLKSTINTENSMAVHPTENLPIWNDELYLEYHRGCYTTQALQKRWNRHGEKLLYQAELFASWATLSAGIDYPKTELETAWKKVLFNQFHDILPGASIPPVYVDANQTWQEAAQIGTEILTRSLQAIAAQIAFPRPPQINAFPIVVFNSLNWQRSQVVTLPLPTLENTDLTQIEWQIYDLEGQPLPSQLSAKSELLFLASEIPSVGYRCFWLCHQDSVGCVSDSVTHHSPINTPPPNWILENEFLRVTVDNQTGDFRSIFDKINQREILTQAGGNQLQSFQDRGHIYWQAWNIDPNYAQYPLSPSELKSIHWVESGTIQQRLRVVRQLGKSEFSQDYILAVRSPILEIFTTVDWQEHHVLVKAAFPLNLAADCATYEIPCGAIQRATKSTEPREQAKWEVPALRWADLTTAAAKTELGETEYGVSLLNDCKHGYDSQPNQLRLTLLRSPNWPDPEADRGKHEFTYAVYPHSGSWQSAQTVRKGYELNLPLQAIICPPVETAQKAALSPVGQLLDLSAENLVLMAFKQSENNPQSWILRCYECHGEPAELSLSSDLELEFPHSVDLLERPLKLLEDKKISISPWQIISLGMKNQ